MSYGDESTSFGALDALVDSILTGYEEKTTTTTAAPHAGHGRKLDHHGTNEQRSPSFAPSRPATAGAQQGHSSSGVPPANCVGSYANQTEDEQSEMSIDKLVDQILAGGGQGGTQDTYGNNINSNSTDDYDDDGDEEQQQQRRQLYWQLPPPPALPLHPASADAQSSTLLQLNNPPSRTHRSSAQQHRIKGTPSLALTPPSTFSSRGSRHHPQQGSKDDALLRRFALWEERRNAKQLKAVYEALVAEAAECSFQPNCSPETLLAEKVFANASPERECPLDRVGDDDIDGHGDGNSSGAGGGGSRRSQSRKFSTATWDSLLAPSSLYAENKAWGFDEYVARMAVVRQEKAKREEEEEEKKRRLYAPDTFTRAPTRPQPFELSCYYKPTATKHVSDSASTHPTAAGKDSHPNSSGRHGRVAPRGGSSRPREDQQQQQLETGDAGDGGVVVVEMENNSSAEYAPYYSSRKPSPSACKRSAETDTFNTIAPVIRQQLLFSEDTSHQLERATSAVKQCFGD